MTRIRIDGPLSLEQDVEVEGTQARHLVTVLRARVGDRVEVLDASGGRWAARVATLAPLTLKVDGVATGPAADPTATLESWIPLLKGGKTDDLVRQLTELGASVITGYTSSRSVARLDANKRDKRVERWRTIACEATRQCGRETVPAVAFSDSLPTLGPGVFFWEEAEAPALEALSQNAGGGTLRVLTGPEGGLDGADAAHLTAAGWRPASLGPRILRAETAVIVAATLGLSALGERGYGDS